MSEATHQDPPAGVSARARQAGDRPARPPEWLTLESGVVWSERMLATLERGIKGGPNAHFADCGLISRKALAHVQELIPSFSREKGVVPIW